MESGDSRMLCEIQLHLLFGAAGTRPGAACDLVNAPGEPVCVDRTGERVADER